MRRTADMAEEIKAEVVANVLNVLVHEGDAISNGDTVVVLESKKMEIPVLVEHAGTVTKLAVHEGDVVQAGDLIAVVE
jgi:acetyl-CoA carboxylase biotin carboxyl carrier protein